MPGRNKSKPLGSFPIGWAQIVLDGEGTLEGKEPGAPFGWTLKSTVVRFRYYVAALRASERHALGPRARGLTFHIEGFPDGRRARVTSSERISGSA